MKLPNWIVAGLAALSAFAVVLAIVWCWLGWPEDTADTFFELVCEKNWEAAEKMLNSDEARRTLDHFRNLEGVTGHLEPKARTWIDLAVGRRSFQFEHCNNPCFTVERGQVVAFLMDEEHVFMFYIGLLR
jgi:hypothetical protein